MCSLSWKNLVVVIAVLTLQISYSNGDKSNCKFERMKEDPGDNNCCFYEPECEWTTTCQPWYKKVWKPKPETIWNCRNFTRKIKECEILEEKEETCKYFKQEICRAVQLPGKCAKVTHKKNCVHKCAKDGYPLFDASIHTQCSHEDGYAISELDLRIGRTHQSGSNPNQLRIQSEQKDDNCCQYFSLSLANEIKTKHSTREGSYVLSSSMVNGFKTWISSNGKSAIWYIKENVWCIGDVDSMSTSLCSIHSRVNVPCPAEIKGEQWNFFIDGDFQNVGSSSNLNLTCQKARTGREGIARPALPGFTETYVIPHAKGHEEHDVHDDPTEIPEGCHESCEYETVDKCCDFPDQQCEEVWLKECITRPKINCTWTNHETCFFFEEEINKYEKIDCLDDEHCTDHHQCEDYWWCKVCDNDNECFKTKEEYHQANTKEDYHIENKQ